MSESTPLLATSITKQDNHGFFSPYRRMLGLAFCLSISFAFTATPILYNYRIFTCEEYYKTHPLPEGKGDRCAVHDIEASTAASLSLMVTLTTISGVLNLLTTGYVMKRWGIRCALITQTAWPMLRNVCQITATIIGGNVGIFIFQVTQLITILGGGAGYILCANSFVSAVVSAEERTGAFGQLQGVCMAGTAVAFTLGGLAGQYISPAAPFIITLCLLGVSTLLSYVILPYIPPVEDKDDGKPGAKKKGVMSFFEPLKVFSPRILWNGSKYWGVTFLGIGAFCAVLASAYVPFMLQLYATNTYGFATAQNGYLMSCFALSRATFLTSAFPRIIKYGRRWYNRNQPVAIVSEEDSLAKIAISATVTVVAASSESSSPTTSETASLAAPAAEQPAQTQVTGFDLAFLRTSILVDGFLTFFVAFAFKGWHMYLAALIIPLASGTAPACKGVMMEMVTKAHRADALSAISLTELLATVSTVSMFGSVFAYLSKIGKPNLVFLLNAAAAMVATVILLFAHLPPEGKVEEEEEETEEGEVLDT